MTQSIFAEIFGRTTGLDRPAILGVEACTYGELLDDADQLASLLKSHCPERAVPVALVLPHGRAYVTALLAAWRSGLVAVPVNPKSTAREKAHALRDSGARIVISGAEDIGVGGLCDLSLKDERRGLRISDTEIREVHTKANDALVIFTSGSTGQPKGVVLTEEGISANVRAVASYLDLSAADRIATFTPPSYAYAINQVLTHLHAGAAILPWPNGLLFPAQLIEEIRTNGITGVQANPTIFDLLLSAGSAPIESIRYVMSGGQPLFTGMIKKLRGLFPGAGIISMYGCTECSPRISYMWIPEPAPEREVCWPVGKAVDGMAIQIARENGELAGEGETGEILVRGSSLMRGYLGDPELTASRFRGGWFRTMDSGFIDASGDLTLVGRIDNILTVGHEKVAPEEVENVIAQVAGVSGVVVGGISDPILTKIPVALVQSDGDWKELLPRIRVACSTMLSRVKIPRHFLHVDSVPRTEYGKIDRVTANDLIAAHFEKSKG